MYVWAINGKGQKRRFTKRSWDLLGANKEGWRETTNEATEIPVKITTKPATGEATKKEAVDQVITNADGPEKKDDQKTDEVKTDEKKTQTVNNVDLKKEFLDEIKTLTKGPIKDFFDHKGVKYNNNAKLDDMKNQLAEYFNNNVFEYKKNFKIK